MLDKISGVYSHGGTFQGDGWNVRSIRYQPYQPKATPVLSVAIAIAPQKMITSAGGEPTQFRGGRNEVIFRLSKDGADWRVTDFERLS